MTFVLATLYTAAGPLRMDFPHKSGALADQIRVIIADELTRSVAEQYQPKPRFRRPMPVPHQPPIDPKMIQIVVVPTDNGLGTKIEVDYLLTIIGTSAANSTLGPEIHRAILKFLRSTEHATILSKKTVEVRLL